MADGRGAWVWHAGWLYPAQLEHIPTTGEKLKWRGFQFEIIDMDGHRIDKVLVQPSQEIKDELKEEEEEEM